MAKVAFMAARSLANREVVMAGANGISFHAPIPIGHVLTLQGRVGSGQDQLHDGAGLRPG